MVFCLLFSYKFNKISVEILSMTAISSWFEFCAEESDVSGVLPILKFRICWNCDFCVAKDYRNWKEIYSMIKRLLIVACILTQCHLFCAPNSIAMSSSDPRNPQKLSLIRSPWCENYERFKNSDDEDETQNDVFSPGKPPPDIVREQFHSSDNGDKFQGG